MINKGLFTNTYEVLLRGDSELNLNYIDFSLIFQIEIDFENEDSYYFIDTIEEFTSIVASINEIVSINIFIYEKPIDIFNISQNKESEIVFFPVTQNHFSLLKFFNNENDAIFNSFLIYDDPDPYAAAYSPEVYFYTSIIELINPNAIDSNLIENIKSKLVQIKIPLYYVRYFDESSGNREEDNYLIKKIFLSNNCRIINTQTKVRRLGYLKLLSKFLGSSKKRNANTVYKEFEFYCDNSETNEQLSIYNYNKGAIKVTKNGISAKPYIKLAKELGLIEILKSDIKLTKIFQVYSSINNELILGDNSFSLNKFDKLFFTELILKYDYLYFSAISKILYIKTEVKFEYLTSIFKDYLLKNIEDYLNENNFLLKDLEKRKLKLIYNRINNWAAPEVYLEHVLMPRLNWLADLGFVDIKDNVFKISKNGNLFFKTLCMWMDIYNGNLIDCEKFLDKFYVKSFGVIFGQNKYTYRKDLSEKIKLIINDYVNDSFEKFKTFAPNRVTLSQTINYIKYKLYITDNFLIDYDSLINYIKEDLKLKYIFKFQKQYNDGYLQKRKA